MEYSPGFCNLDILIFGKAGRLDGEWSDRAERLKVGVLLESVGRLVAEEGF